jgi:rubrerythrin
MMLSEHRYMRTHSINTVQMATENNSKEKLIALLQLAYSGELAAAHAYRGHWRSVRNPDEKTSIKNIEDDEWRHRRLVGEMLTGLGSGPSRRREIRATVIGRTLGLLCHFTGWLAPMYGAGKLESRNIREYETAARYARVCGRIDLIDCLLEMAEVESEHELCFRSRVLTHALSAAWHCGRSLCRKKRFERTLHWKRLHQGSKRPRLT